MLTGCRTTMVWGGELTCADCSPLQGGCTLCFTRGTSSLSLALVGSFDLQQHHLITSIAVRRVLVSFDGAEQRSFMQMPLQMNAQAFFFLGFLLLLFVLLSLILAKTPSDVQNGERERESEEVRPPPAFHFRGVFFFFQKNWTGGGAFLK